MRIYDGRTEFYQYDTNQKLICDSCQVGEEIHFSNNFYSKAAICKTYEHEGSIVVDVPNLYLLTSGELLVYLTHVDDGGRSTLEQYAFVVKERKRPSDYVYTETEVLSYHALESKFEELKSEVTKASAGKKLPTGSGEIFNDYENNDSNIPYAHIAGKNNKAVVRCFLIKSFTANSITLDSVEGIEVGMPFNVFCPDEEEGYDKHRGKILSIDSATNTVTLDNDGVQITNIDTWSGFAPSSEPTFFNTFICNGGTIGTYVINDVDFEYFTVTMSGENNIAYLNTRVHGTSNKGLAFNAVIDGYKCIVRGERGVAFNYKTEANGNESFAINLSTKANGAGSFAQGSLTEANGPHASSFGRGTVASGYASMARGKYNTIDEEGIYLEQVGNGSDANNRSDAYTLDIYGNGRFGKDVYADKNKKLATEIFVTNKNIEILADAKNYAKNYAENYAEQKKKAANEYTDECISNLSYMTYKGSTNEIPEDGGNFGDTYTATEDITLSIKRFRVPTMGGITFKPEDGVILSTTILNDCLWYIQFFENLIKILDGGYAGSKLYQDGEIITKEITFKKPRKLFIWAAGKIDSENFAETFEVEATGFMADGNNGTVRLLGKWINDHGIGYNCKINTISGWIYYHTDNVYHNDSELYDIENVYKYHTGIKPVASTITFPKNSTIHRSENDGWVTLAKNQVTDGFATEEYVDTKIAAIPTPDVSRQINTHNTDTLSHNDIRLLIDGLTTRLNALADSDDTTLDQLSEIVAYIKSNKELIEAVTTSKVNVEDIIDNLTTNVSDKPLSAAQGVALKALIDSIKVPTKVSELTNDKGYLTGYTETDPTVPAWAKTPTKPTYTADEVGADASGTASSVVSEHSLDTTSHADIREQISQISKQVDNIRQDVTNDKLKTFIDNTDIDYAFDSVTNANYTIIRIYKNKIDGTKQYPFVYAPDGVNACTKTTHDLSNSEGWLLAINSGIFYVNTDGKNGKPNGIVIENGVVIQNEQSGESLECKPLTIDENGDLGYAAYNADASELVNNGIISAVTGFMPIIVDYQPVPSSEWNSVAHYIENAQRQIIGQFGNGDYAIITCEGRNFNNSDGWTIEEAQTICQRHGLKFAYNLDGGGSTETMLGLKHLNTIYENATGRKVPTFIVFNGSTVFGKPDDLIEPEKPNTSENPIYWVVGKTSLHYPDREITGLGVDSNRITTYQTSGTVTLSNIVWSDQEQQNIVSGDTGLYPVKIPEGAISVIVTVPSGYVHGIQFYELVNGAYVRTADPGWNGNQGIYQLVNTDYSASYIQVNVRNDANTDIDTGVDVTQFSIKFEYFSKLPSGYTELPYIVVPNGAYINTGIPASSDYDAEGKQQAGSLHVLSAENYYYPTFMQIGDSRICRYTRYGTEYKIPFEFSYNNSYAWSVFGDTVSIDGNVMETAAQKGNTTPSGNLYLFCYGGDPTNTKYHFMNGKFYYLRLFDKTSGQILYEYLPCKNSNGVVGLYETVNKKFYGSDTDVAFVQA